MGPRFAEYFTNTLSFKIDAMILRPGITGWAQVNGRNAIWSQKFEYVWYVDNEEFCT
jgi:lipopolysaccharide/colanic/teichoic acid biosynthesis glycosyltransferase